MMCGNKVWGTGLLMVLLMLSSLACGLGDSVVEPTIEPGSETADPPETLSESAQDSLPETAVEPALSDLQVEMITAALLEKFDEDAAFLAAAASFERGYSLAQLEAGALIGEVQGNGQILDKDGSIVPPVGQPAGLLDLSELSAKGPTLGKEQRLYQDSPASPEDFLAWFQQIYKPENAGGGEPLAIYLLLTVINNGYTPDQIFLAWAAGDTLRTTRVETASINGETRECVGFVGVNGRYVPPERVDFYIEQCMNAFDERFDETVEEDPQTEAEADSETTEEPDGTLSLVTYEPILNSCTQDDAGDYYVVTCNYSLEVQVEYEVTVLPAYAFCNSRRFGISGIGSVALDDNIGETTLTIPNLDVIDQYNKSDGIPSPSEDGQYYSLSCSVGPVANYSEVAWDSFNCLHPDETDRDCVAPWLDLSQGH